MIRLLKSTAQKFIIKFLRYEKCPIEEESEYLAMSCGSFNSRFLAKIKRCKSDIGR